MNYFLTKVDRVDQKYSIEYTYDLDLMAEWSTNQIAINHNGKK